MEIYKATSIDDLFQKLEKFRTKSKAWIFRGQSDSSWNLLPKIARDGHSIYYDSVEGEKYIYQSWGRYANHFLNKEPIDDWDILTLAQHYGLETRLLDWSKNPLTALFFSTLEKEKSDAALFVTYILSGETQIPKTPLEVKNFTVYFPKGLSARIINQRGLFTVSQKPQEPLEKTIDDRLFKIVIPKKFVGELNEKLDFWGINEFTIYQDLDSLSRYTNSYFKKLKVTKYKDYFDFEPFK